MTISLQRLKDEVSEWVYKQIETILGNVGGGDGKEISSTIEIYILCPEKSEDMWQ